MKSSSLIRMIEKDGWHIVRKKDSHHHFKDAVKKGIGYYTASAKRCANWNRQFNLKTGWT